MFIRIVALLGVVFILIITVACGPQKFDWFDTKEQAINAGLLEENTSIDLLLSVEEINDSTLVFYDYNDALGIAEIIEKEDMFRWHRGSPYTDFEGVSPFVTANLEVETKSGQTILIVAGKVLDTSIRKIKLLEFENEKVFELSEHSKLFYFIVDSFSASIMLNPEE